MKLIPYIVVVIVGLTLLGPADARHSSWLRLYAHRHDPCLAAIVDHEDGTWAPTRSFGNGHDINASYGLAQADPGTKMAGYSYTVGNQRAGARVGNGNWRYSGWVQLKWAKNYAIGRYGSTCAAWGYWQTHNSW